MTNSSIFTPVPVGSLRLQLGESPIWDRKNFRLLCVDIERHNIHRIDTVTGDVETITVGKLPSALGLCQSGKLIVAKLDGIFLSNFSTESAHQLCNPISHQPTARLNDGKVAPDGSFWIGTMQNNISSDGNSIEITSDIGGFYRIDADGTFEQLIPNELGIANTLAWSPDNSYFFYADSMKGTIYRAETRANKPINPVIFNNDFDRGVPDGSAMDAEGFLWNCRWGGSCVVRFSPAGYVDQIIDLPATNITSCAFGGPSNKTLFVTSARSGLDAEQLSKNPLEGAIFAIVTSVSGMGVSLFAD